MNETKKVHSITTCQWKNFLLFFSHIKQIIFVCMGVCVNVLVYEYVCISNGVREYMVSKSIDMLPKGTI